MAAGTAQKGFEARVDAALGRWVGFVERHARATLWTIVALTLVALVLAATQLGINSDNIRLLGEDLPVRQRHDAFARVFPNLTNALLVVVDGPTPEATRDAAQVLTARLTQRRDAFAEVYLPGSGSFFERNGLLYLTKEELSELGDQIARLQPFLIALEREPTIASLASLVQAGLERMQPGDGDPAALAAVLDRIGSATVSVYEEYPVAVSWEDLFVRGSALEANTRQVIVAEPILDFESALPAANALRAVREEAAAQAATAVRVRVTGNPALNHEEMLALVWDVGVSGVVSFALVVGLIWIALRSWRLVGTAVATLLVGLVWTTAFAAIAIGDLNLISLTFAVMYIGLGIDFAIHLGMHYAELLRQGEESGAALQGATRLVGTSLVLCTLTTTIGFYAFLPTDYLGVAELGGIAGTGMIVILFQTITLFPALLSSWLRPPEGATPTPELRLPAGSSSLTRHPRAVRRTAALVALACLFAVPALRFDPNVVELRNPRTESVQAFQDLVAGGGAATPWYADVLTPDLAAAQALAGRLRETPGVARAITLADFVPTEQDEKREILADVALLLDPAAGGAASSPSPPAAQIAALRALRDTLVSAPIERDATAFGASARKLRGELDAFLARVERDADPEPELARLEEALLAPLPRQLARLRAALDPDPVSAEDLPRQLAARMVAADGQARVQVFAEEDLRDPGALARFTEAVQAVAPEATGMAVDLVGFGRVIARSLVEALAAATIAIALLVFLLWRRVEDVLLALAPLVLAGLGIAAAMVMLGLSFNFANAIVLPLLLGVGVDSGIHLVHRARAGGPGAGSLLGTTTARAVFYSFVTTVLSFGNLAFSSHRGIASLGLLLTIGLTLTTFCNLVVLPALIEWRLGARAIGR